MWLTPWLVKKVLDSFKVFILFYFILLLYFQYFIVCCVDAVRLHDDRLGASFLRQGVTMMLNTEKV